MAYLHKVLTEKKIPHLSMGSVIYQIKVDRNTLQKALRALNQYSKARAILRNLNLIHYAARGG